MNEYLTMYLARERFERAREFAARQAMLRDSVPPRRPLRIRLGEGLIRAGHFLLRRAPEWATEPRHSS
jgi:hypothetical protein